MKKKAKMKKTTYKKTVQKKTVKKKAARKKTVQKKTAQQKGAKKKLAEKTEETKTAKKKSVQKKTVQKRIIRNKTALSASRGIKRVKRMLPAAAREKSTVPGSAEIPHGYNEDTIVIMPVNADTSFIYWEITERRLKRKKKKLQSRSAKLMIKVFEGHTRKEVSSFVMSDRIGKHYMKYHASLKPLVAEIGVLEGNTFSSLLKSSPMMVSSSFRKTIDDEIWMRRIKDTFEIVRIPATGAIEEPALQWLLEKYYLEATAFGSGSFFGSMYLPFP